MPIKPENQSKYPSNWIDIRRAILTRAKDQCERCGLFNYAIGYRDKSGIFYPVPQVRPGDRIKGHKVFRVVLTIAHLDHNPENNDFSNLQALCQKCHLTLDADQHRLNSARTRYQKKFSFQLTLQL